MRDQELESESFMADHQSRPEGHKGPIAAVFLLESRNEEYLLEYLLRRYSGKYYRPRYPTMMLL